METRIRSAATSCACFLFLLAWQLPAEAQITGAFSREAREEAEQEQSPAPAPDAGIEAGTSPLQQRIAELQGILADQRAVLAESIRRVANLEEAEQRLGNYKERTERMKSRIGAADPAIVLSVLKSSGEFETQWPGEISPDDASDAIAQLEQSARLESLVSRAETELEGRRKQQVAALESRLAAAESRMEGIRQGINSSNEQFMLSAISESLHGIRVEGIALELRDLQAIEAAISTLPAEAQSEVVLDTFGADPFAHIGEVTSSGKALRDAYEKRIRSLHLRSPDYGTEDRRQWNLERIAVAQHTLANLDATVDRHIEDELQRYEDEVTMQELADGADPGEEEKIVRLVAAERQRLESERRMRKANLMLRWEKILTESRVELQGGTEN